MRNGGLALVAGLPFFRLSVPLADVCLGSLADLGARIRDVGFYPQERKPMQPTCDARQP